ncbi:MAG: hypothetical protein IKS11_00360, partial [Lachnospiraceae bacterium]|nr:hypothetical protein [Lachnospiraceae bacterium]
MKKRLFALLMAAVMVLALTACGEGGEAPAPVTATPTPGTAATITATPTPAPTATSTPVPTATPTPIPPVEGGPASIDFEDGNSAFVVIQQPTIGSDNSAISVEEIGGSKVLLAANTFGKKEAYLGFDLAALLGDKIADVKTIKFDAGAYGGEAFAPISGVLWTFTGEGAATKATNYEWSVYLETKNPRTITFDINETFAAGQNNYIIIGKTDDVAGNQGFFIDNMKFFDAAGNLIAADTTVQVSAASPLNATDEVRLAYGYYTPLNGTYQGDWTTGAAIPAAFFADAQGPVNVVLDVLVLNPSDWAGFFCTDKDWAKPTADFFADITTEGNGIIHFQDDGALIFDDLGATQISFTITKEAAEKYASNGGMFFPGYNAQVLGATVSDSTFKCVNNTTYQGDWTTGVAIPAAFFADAQGPVNVTLDVLVLNPSDWAGFFCTDKDWAKPTADFFADITTEGNGVIHFQDDGALIFD